MEQINLWLYSIPDKMHSIMYQHMDLYSTMWSSQRMPDKQTASKSAVDHRYLGAILSIVDDRQVLYTQTVISNSTTMITMSNWWLRSNLSNKQIIVTENDIQNIFLTSTEIYKLTVTMRSCEINFIA